MDVYRPPEDMTVNTGTAAVTGDNVTNVIAPPIVLNVVALVKVFVMAVAVTAGLFTRTIYATLMVGASKCRREVVF